MTARTTPIRLGMFSPKNPSLQVGWDATCMSDLLKCPRYYLLTHLKGWSRTSVHLDFGIYVALGLQTFQRIRMAGGTKIAAILGALRVVLEATWNEDGSQWGGYWENQWKCAGTEPYKNAKGNKAKCPYSHKRMWFPPPAPDVCGECGSGVIRSMNYCPDNSIKNRVNLARAIVWYGLDQPDDLEDGLHPYRFPNGEPAVELSWRVPLPRTSPHGDTYLLCGHFDYLGQFGDEIGPVDNKTTKYTLSKSYFAGFSPHVQFDTYDMVAPLLFPEIDFSWIAIDAIQILTDTIRTGRQFYRKTHDMRVEHYDTVMEVIDRAERYAEANKWPMDKSSCAMCPFKEVCSAPEEDREAILEEKFVTRFWNPLENR